MTNEIELYKIQDMIRQIERLNNNCADNMKRLNQMMLELRGIIAMVRPMAKKNDWYGKEIAAQIEAQLERMPEREFVNVHKVFDDKRQQDEVKKILCSNDFYINPDPKKEGREVLE